MEYRFKTFRSFDLTFPEQKQILDFFKRRGKHTSTSLFQRKIFQSSALFRKRGNAFATWPICQRCLERYPHRRFRERGREEGRKGVEDRGCISSHGEKAGGCGEGKQEIASSKLWDKIEGVRMCPVYRRPFSPSVKYPTALGSSGHLSPAP